MTTLTLTPQQKKAIETTEGRLLILAGAGSGKTRVIVQRIAYLIKEKKVDPNSILGLTFTNKAADEMKMRLCLLLGKKIGQEVTLCTFHSFCMSVLREHIHHLGYTTSFSLYDEKDRLRLVTHLAKDILKMEKDLPSLSPTIAEMSRVKNEQGSLDGLDPLTKEIFEETEKAMRAYNAVDFDSLIPLCIKLFKEKPEVLELVQKRFKYLMIDEYQDTNPSQNALAEIICEKSQNICVVGDDDQSIYGWRGAKVDFILKFSADHVVKLEQNFRSTENIIKGANAVIKKNKQRHDKTLFSTTPKTSSIKVFVAPNEEEEANAVVKKLLYLKKEHDLKWKDIAILYRSNILSRTMEMALINASYKKDNSWVRGIPYKVYGGLEFSERAEIKDIFAYLRFIQNPRDTEALLRIINVPRRGISNQTLDLLTTHQRKQKDISLWQLLKDPPLDLGISKRGILGIESFVELIYESRKAFQEKPLDQALIQFIKDSNYQKAITEDVKSEKMQAFKWENVQSVIQALKSYQEEVDKPNLSHFISSSMLNKEKHINKKESLEENKVSLMTLHSAKGLEFESCFIMGVEDHLLPHEKSVLETGVEEERRLFYVGMTRAKKHLTLSMSQNRKYMGSSKKTSPSRFLHEIPKELIQAVSYKDDY